MKWQDALEGYWLAKRLNFSEHTIADYELTFRRFGRWIRNCDVEEIGPADVQAFLAHLRDDLGLSKKTIQNHWTALSSFWTWASDMLETPHIMRKVERPKYRRKIQQPFTEDEVRRLVAATATFRSYSPQYDEYVDAGRQTAKRDIAIMVLMVATGIRLGELVALDIRDYDRQRGRIVVRHGKGDKQRILFVGETAKQYLWRYLVADRRNAGQAEPLFTTREGRRMDNSSVRLMVRRAGKRAGVTGATPHRFRHTFAINFLRNGGSLLELQDLLGHEKLDTVRIYARLAEVDLESAQRRANVADIWRL